MRPFQLLRQLVLLLERGLPLLLGRLPLLRGRLPLEQVSLPRQLQLGLLGQPLLVRHSPPQLGRPRRELLLQLRLGQLLRGQQSLQQPVLLQQGPMAPRQLEVRSRKQSPLERRQFPLRLEQLRPYPEVKTLTYHSTIELT